MNPSPEALELDESLKTLRLAIGTPLESLARMAHEVVVARIKAKEKAK